MRAVVTAACIGLLAAIPLHLALSAEIVVSTGYGTTRTMPRIEVVGEIRSGDAALFAQRLREAAEDSAKIIATPINGVPVISVHLDSNGGDVIEAEKIGRQIRAAFATTFVERGKVCLSACVLILASGVERWPRPGAKVGIHRPQFDPAYFANLTAQQARARYESMLADVKAYLAEIGASDDLYKAMRAVPSDSIRILSDHELRVLGIEGEDPAWQEFSEAKQIKQFGAKRWAWIKKCKDKADSGDSQIACYYRAYKAFPAD